jgi:ABC-type molybdenum transport system, ATPase component/photorepair protein PhrA
LIFGVSCGLFLNQIHMNHIPELASLTGVSVKMNGVDILKNISLSVKPGEQWAIVGKNGSGKTTLAQALTGQVFHQGSVAFHLPEKAHSGRVLLIEQQHRFKNRSNTSDLYYQQRYNSFDAEDTITVEEALRQAVPELPASYDQWISKLHLQPLLQEPLIQLSNGENKRLQLALALLRNPAVLVMDNPFVGLDTEGRQTLHQIIDSIVADGIHIILITAPQELPASITHVAVLENGHLVQAGPKSEWKPETMRAATKQYDIKKLQPLVNDIDFDIAVKMVNVTIKYGDRIILDHINWEVKKGECWSLSGPNGAGKSTLLSLITADNPQAYANELYLFDQRRGSGESIWDIKKRIGFVSPELHVFFDRGTSCFNVVASGLFDTIGLFRQLSATQETQVKEWLNLLQLNSLQRKPLFQLSLGQQRLVLLARALVKNPPLLILDEPCQGLDEEQTTNFKELINTLCTRFGTTLLYVSHYVKDIPECVTHSAKLAQGTLIV